MITWIRYYRVHPDHEAELVHRLRAAVHPVLGAPSADGKVLEWGIAAPLSVNDDSWTHLIWIDFADWAAMDAFVETMVDAELPAVVARDAFLRHTVDPDVRLAVRARYIVFHLHWIRRGHDDDALALFHEWARPVFEELAAAGKVGAWAQMMEDTAVGGEWRCLVRYPITDLGVLDDVLASLLKFEMPRLKSFEHRLQAMSERNYRGQILRVLHQAP